jgi:hypothetical protein
MYMIKIRRKGQKKWHPLLFIRTLHLAKNGLIKGKEMAQFFADTYSNQWYETKIVKIN